MAKRLRGFLQVQPLDLLGLLLLTPVRHADERGFFVETWNSKRFDEHGIRVEFVQDNLSQNKLAGTVAGLHFQKPPSAQAKLVSVLRGRIFDVVVDLRKTSAGFGKWVSVELSAANGQQLFIPHGFAHGYCTLETDTEVAYKVDGYYDKSSEAGIRWDDPDLAIAWPAASPIHISARDASLPGFREQAAAFAGLNWKV